MPYIKEICVAGKILEVRKYHTIRYNVRGEKRTARVKLTGERQKKVNERESLRKLTRSMNTNFSDETGMLVTLTYLPAKRPAGSSEMADDMRNFLKKLRKIFKKNDDVLKFIYVKELGKKGAAHIHILMSICAVTDIRKCWNKGGVNVKPLWSDGDYSGIAKYFLKYADKTIETEGELVGKRWNSSHNLKRPIIIRKVVNANTFNMRIPEKPGYVLDQTSVQEGYTEFGYRYFSYTMKQTAPVAPVQKGGG